MKIYKYELDVTSQQSIFVPKDAKILHVGVQRGIICLWVLLDTTEITDERIIYLYGTGHEINDVQNKKYIGTVQIDPYVWHLFE